MILPSFTLVLLAINFVFAAKFSSGNDKSQPRTQHYTKSGIASYCVKNGDIALTFDEGPSQYTVKVLQGLQNNKMNATFHVITKYFQNVAFVTNMETAYRQGHVIGLRYPNKKVALTEESDKEIRSTLLAESETIHQYIGVYPKFLRFPFGKYDDRAVEIAKSLGFVVTGWNVDPMDYQEGMNAAQLAQTYLNQFTQVGAGLGRYIGLHHDIYPVYQDPAVFQRLKNAFDMYKYRTVTISECLGDSEPYRRSNLVIDESIFDIECSLLDFLNSHDCNNKLNDTILGASSGAYGKLRAGVFLNLIIVFLVFMAIA